MKIFLSILFILLMGVIMIIPLFSTLFFNFYAIKDVLYEETKEKLQQSEQHSKQEKKHDD